MNLAFASTKDFDHAAILLSIESPAKSPLSMHLHREVDSNRTDSVLDGSADKTETPGFPSNAEEIHAK